MTILNDRAWPIEFQDWVLISVTLTCFWLFFLPCWLSGIPSLQARKLAHYLQHRLPAYLLLVLSVSFLLLVFTIWILPDWTWRQYWIHFIKCFQYITKHIAILAQSAIILFCFFLAYVLKDRILIVLGLEDESFIRLSWRDVTSCCYERHKVVEVYLWKVEELASQTLIKANDVFVQLDLGWNETVRTRVHKNAGDSCVFKEVLQMNFDPGDQDERLVLECKHQDVFMSSTIATLELSNKDVSQVIGIDDLQQFRLSPQGKIWLSIRYVDEYDEEIGGGGTMRSLV